MEENKKNKISRIIEEATQVDKYKLQNVLTDNFDEIIDVAILALSDKNLTRFLEIKELDSQILQLFLKYYKQNFSIDVIYVDRIEEEKEEE